MDNVLVFIYSKLHCIIDIDTGIIVGNPTNIEVEKISADLLLSFCLIFT